MRSLRLFLTVSLVVGLLSAALHAIAVNVSPVASVGVLLSLATLPSLLGLYRCFNASLTMLDIAKLNGNDKVVGLIEENVKKAPEVMVFPFRTIRGTSYKTGIRTALPTTAFRSANEGQTPSKSTFAQRLIEAFIFGGQIEVDKAVADAHEDGPQALQALEASGIMESAFRSLGTQIWYGTTADSKGFPGLKAATPFGTSTAAGDALTVNATGSTATTASSVYAVKFGAQDVTLIGGNNRAWQLDDFTVQQITAANNGKLTAYVAGLTGWIGLQAGHENCVRRIANLTADSGKGLTDTLLAELFSTFPVGMVPDALFMSRRSRFQLQKSRSATSNTSGKADKPMAPIPTEYEGVPIYATDSILNTDAIES